MFTRIELGGYPAKVIYVNSELVAYVEEGRGSVVPSATIHFLDGTHLDVPNLSAAAIVGAFNALAALTAKANG